MEHAHTLDLISRLYPGQLYLGTAQLAKLVGSSPAAVRTMLARGALPIPSSAIGEASRPHHRFAIDDIAAYLDSKVRKGRTRQGRPALTPWARERVADEAEVAYQAKMAEIEAELAGREGGGDVSGGR